MKRTLLVFVLLALLLAPAVNADGGFVAPMYFEEEIFEPSQNAILFFDGSEETLILQVSYEGEMDEFAWIVPVPSYPQLEQSTARLFVELYFLTVPEMRHAPFDLVSFGTLEGKANTRAGVTVHEEKIVGPYQTAVLSAEEPDALVSWLQENEYAVPDRLTSLIDFYIEKQWYFVAMQIRDTTRAKGESGTIEPLQLSFETESIVYPLRISSFNSGETEVLLYTIAPYKTEVMNLDGFTEEYGNWLRGNTLKNLNHVKDPDYYRDYRLYYMDADYDDEYAIYRADLDWMDELESEGYFLTKLRGTLRPSEMTDDLVLGQADNNDEFRIVMKEENYYLKTLRNLFVLLLALSMMLLIIAGPLFLASLLLLFVNNLIVRDKESPYRMDVVRALKYTAVVTPFFALPLILSIITWWLNPDTLLSFLLVAVIPLFVLVHLVWSGVLADREKKSRGKV